MKKYLIAAAALMAGAAALAQTAPVAPEPAVPPMAHPTVNNAMTRAEMVAMVRDHFARWDADKDSAISRDEFAKIREQRIEKRMHRGSGMSARLILMADTNKDGRITLSEAEALALQHFDRMDTNHDGQVTPDERRAARPMMKRMQAPSAG